MKTTTATANEMIAISHRLDASYHSSDGVQALRFIHRWATHDTEKNIDALTFKEADGSYHIQKTNTLSDLCVADGIFIGGRAKRIYVQDPEYGIPFLSSSDMLQATFDGVNLISKKQAGLNSMLLDKGWTLISRSGTVGNVVYARDDMVGLAASEHIMRVVPDTDKVTSGYLFTFLNSPLGQGIIKSGTYGSVVDTISSEFVGTIPIPRINQNLENHIHELIEKAAGLRVMANQLIQTAIKHLLLEVGLRPLTPNDYYFYGASRSEQITGAFTVSSQSISSLTINAWNYADKFEQMKAWIKSGKKHERLEKLMLPNGYTTGSAFKRIETEENQGIQLINQKQLFTIHKQGKWISKSPIRDLEAELVPNGTILIAGVGTMGESEVFGRCEFAWKNLENKIVAAEVIRVQADPEKIDPGYLFAFLSSEYGFRLLRSTITGTKLCRFIEPLVLNMPVPLLSKDLQVDIGNQIRKAYDNRAQAIEIEANAQSLLLDALGWKGF